MNIFVGIIGAGIAILCLIGGIGTYQMASTSIHQIYAALLMITSALGLVVVAVSVGAATIHDALVKSRESASQEHQQLIGILKAPAPTTSL